MHGFMNIKFMCERSRIHVQVSVNTIVSADTANGVQEFLYKLRQVMCEHHN